MAQSGSYYTSCGRRFSGRIPSPRSRIRGFQVDRFLRAVPKIETNSREDRHRNRGSLSQSKLLVCKSRLRSRCRFRPFSCAWVRPRRMRGCSENRNEQPRRSASESGVAIAIEVVGLQKPIAIPMPIPTLFVRLGASPAHEGLLRSSWLLGALLLYERAYTAWYILW